MVGERSRTTLRTRLPSHAAHLGDRLDHCRIGRNHQGFSDDRSPELFYWGESRSTNEHEFIKNTESEKPRPFMARMKAN